MKKRESDTVSLHSIWKSDPLRTTAILYLSLPLLLFSCGFLKWYLTAVCIAGLLLVVFWTLKYQSSANREKRAVLSQRTVFFVFLFTLLWSYLGGLNGYYYQTSDWDCRNAIYFDLIRYPWPVIYPKSGGALVYYIGHWLPPAALAKAVFSITGSAEAGLVAGRMLLWVWSSVGLTIIILLLFRLMKAENRKRRIAVTALFVFFSGLDIVGAVCTQKLGYLLGPETLHLEWWSNPYEYSSMTTCLFWVFNQSIIPWIATACFLMDDDPGNYIFYCVSCLLTGPLACVGLVILMLIKALTCLVKKLKEKQARGFFRTVFSGRNIVSFVVLFPAAALFILSNNTVGGNSASVSGAYSAGSSLGSYLKAYLDVPLFEFLLLEAGLYLLFIVPDFKKDPMYYTIALCLVAFPYFHIGTSNDFCMRASIPALFVLMLYTGRFLFDHFRWPDKEAFTVSSEGLKIRRIFAWMLAICLVIGAVTPVVEIYRGFYNVADKKSIFLEDQSIMTFNAETVPYNFGCDEPKAHLFFRYLAR